MPQRLSATDTTLLTLESAATPMQTGGLGIFAPGLSFSSVHRTLRARLHEVPRARQRLQAVAFGAGRPAWVDDVDFDLSYHLRHAALPAPGSREQLTDFLSRLMGRPLDRDRPLWELYVIEGLEGGRTGLFRKVHLAMAGAQTADVFSVLLDEAEDAPIELEQAAAPAWEPSGPPGTGHLLWQAAVERLERMVELGGGLRNVAGSPAKLLTAAGYLADTAVGLAGRLVRQAPSSHLNCPLTPHRRFAMTRASLADFREVRRAYGGTINDIVITVCADAVGRLLRWRGHDTKDLDLRVMVPVRVADGEMSGEQSGVAEAPTVGEGVVGVLAPLPVMDMDPVARLYRVMGELAGLKESRQAVAADQLVRLAGYAPPNLHALAARLASAEHRYNVALSNAPGPQSPRWLRGTLLEESYPFIPLAGDSALSIAVSSYVGEVFFGLLGDRSAMEDLDQLAVFIDEAVAELVAVAAPEG